MPLPSRTELEVPLLRALAALGGTVRVPNEALYAHIRGQLPLTDEPYDPVHARPTWIYTLQWVRYALVQRGELDGSQRGIWRLTNAGRQRLGLPPLPEAPAPAVPVAAPAAGRAIVYQLTVADVQTVAATELGRALTPPEVAAVAARLPDYIPWHDAIDAALHAALPPGAFPQ